MSRLVPDGFLTIRQAAEKLAVAMYSGIPDRLTVKGFKELGIVVADGAANDEAFDEIWVAVDGGKIQTFVVGRGRVEALKLSDRMSKSIPGLRHPRGADFSLLRPRNPLRKQFVEWFGPDLSVIAIMFRETEIDRLARTLLRARRRRVASSGASTAGRPQRQVEVKAIIREVVDQGARRPTESMKALTREVNRRVDKLVSDDTVRRALDDLHRETGDRRFERVRRVTRPA
jgi:hypothetical protein